MWVMTVDQEASRRRGDQVEALLDSLRADGPLAGAPGRPSGLERPFERTAGDEVQAVFADPGLAVDVALHVLDLGGWTVGIGAGAVDRPLPAHARAGSGSAFILARGAVEAAKARRPRTLPPLAVRGEHPDVAREAEAVLVLLGSIAARRTPEGRAVVDLVRRAAEPLRQQDLADALGITQQAVSMRLRTALWAEESAARPAAARLLRLAGTGGDDGPADVDREGRA